MYKKISSIWAMALVLFLAIFLPYYVSKSGYYHMGTDKYHFFFYGMVPFVIALILLFVYSLYKKKHISLSHTDICVLAFSVCCLFSHMTSINKSISFWGQNEWHLGLITQLFFVLIYYGISRFLPDLKHLFPIISVVNVPLTLLAICNRFGFYPLQIPGQHPLYVSTIGNINWYCGYLIMLVGMEMILYFLSNTALQKITYGICLFFSLLSLICQGSMSGYATLVCLLLFLLRSAFNSKQNFLRYLEIFLMLFSGCTFMYISSYFIPGSYVEYDEIIHLVAFTKLPCICLFITALFYILLLYGTEKIKLNFLYKYIVFFCILLLAGYFILCAFNTFLPKVTPFFNNNAYFTFNRFYFSTRGGTYAIGIEAFFSLPFYRRLLGIGPDCFLTYVYNHLDVIPTAKYFQIQPLANAHNEFLTMLVNLGILGGFSYMSIFFCSIKSALNRPKNRYAKILLFGILGYMVNNLFSFQQIISTPFVFMLLGMLENLLRKEKTNVAH